MAEAGEVLRLPDRVDAGTAGALWREWSPRAARIAAIDFAAVSAIDSAGVALVRSLAELARRAGAASPELRATPPRYRQLCLAHRIEPGTN
jgi:ABC-type transporter Mla MlaB component